MYIVNQERIKGERGGEARGEKERGGEGIKERRRKKRPGKNETSYQLGFQRT